MKYRNILILFSLLIVFTACSSNISDNEEMTVTFLTDINCEKCETKLFKHIPHEKGIVNLKVNIPEKLVTITFNQKATDIETLIKIFDGLGYTAEVKK